MRGWITLACRDGEEAKIKRDEDDAEAGTMKTTPRQAQRERSDTCLTIYAREHKQSVRSRGQQHGDRAAVKDRLAGHQAKRKFSSSSSSAQPSSSASARLRSD